MTGTSLRLLLLQRLLPAMLALLLAGAGTAYWVAWGSATKAYDRALFDATLALAEQLRVVDGRLQLPLTPQARAVLLTDKFDEMFYAVRGPAREILDGEPGLPLPPPTSPRLAGGEGRVYYDAFLNGRPIRIAALQREIAGQPVTVLAGETLVKRNALVREIIVGMLLPELLLILVAVAVVWFGVRSGLRPLSALRQALADRSPSDLRPVEVVVPEEIRPVVTEVNGLLQRLDDSLSSQRAFVSDAAHQLRTPIAALQAQVEATLNEPPAGERLRLDGILGATQRLAHLVDQLLALARAEPSPTQTQPEIALADVARRVAETWLPAALKKGIDLGFELAPAHVRGNDLLLQELLGNLLDNAIRHTPAGGTITVACGSDDGRAWLAVEDSGPGVPPAERGRVFERFYQTPGSRSEGCGLGLAIVRRIARQHDAVADVDSSPRTGGARFVVRFGAAGQPAP